VTTSLDDLRAELSISDPWEIAACIPQPLRVQIVQFADDWATAALTEPILVNGIRVLFALASPRHAGDRFERGTSRPVPVNIVLSACEVTQANDRREVQKAIASMPYFLTIGDLSLEVSQDESFTDTRKFS